MTPRDTESHLFFAFVLKTQTSGSFLEALSIICPGLVRLQLHFIFILRHSLCKQPKMESGSGGGPKTVNSTAAASLALSASAVRSVTRGMRSLKRSRGSRRAKAALCPPHQRGVFRGKITSPPSSCCQWFPVGKMCKSPQTGNLCSRQSTALLWNHMRMAADSHGPESCETALRWLVGSASRGGASSAGENKEQQCHRRGWSCYKYSIKHHVPAFCRQGTLYILRTSI